MSNIPAYLQATYEKDSFSLPECEEGVVFRFICATRPLLLKGGKILLGTTTGTSLRTMHLNGRCVIERVVVRDSRGPSYYEWLWLVKELTGHWVLE